MFSDGGFLQETCPQLFFPFLFCVHLNAHILTTIMAAVYTCIQEIFGLNLGWDTKLP